MGKDSPDNHGTLRFGDFELDPLRRRLMARENSTPVPVTAKVFDTLLYLVEHPGRLIDKHELMAALWPNVVVEEGNLTQAIHTLRRALGERAGEHRYIVTVPGRGYRFVAQVEPVRPPDGIAPAPASTAPAPPSPAPAAMPAKAGARRWMWIAAGALVALAVLAWWRMDDDGASTPTPVQAASLAVLPFADLSPDEDQAYFADGLAEEILNLLVRVPGLRVIARTSSFAFRGANVDIQAVRERLGVTHVLEGSVRKSGDRVRVTAQLIDAHTSSHLWSAIYDRELRDVFELQSAIATAIAAALDLQLSDVAELAAQAGSTNTEAHERYLQGRYFLARRQAPDVKRARAAFEAATGLDPGYSPAWSGLAATWHIETAERRLLPTEAQRWHEAALRAIETGPGFAEAHMRMGQYLFWAGDIAQAQRHFDEAQELQPSDPLVRGMQLGVAVVEGRLEDATALAMLVAANDPVSAVDRANAGALLLATGRHREAIAELRTAADLGHFSPEARNLLCKALLLDGREDEALAALDGVAAGPQSDQCIALVHQARGEPARAGEIIARLAAGAAAQPDDWMPHVIVAELLTSAGHTDAAFEALRSAAASPAVSSAASGGWRFAADLQLSHLLAPLRADPRWEALLAARRAAWERQREGW